MSGDAREDAKDVDDDRARVQLIADGGTRDTADAEHRQTRGKEAQRAQRVFKYLGVVALVAGVALAAALLVHGKGSSRKFPVLVGGYCAALACVISMLQVLEHLSVFVRPDLQIYVVRVLLMVPVYASTSWLAIVWMRAAPVLDLLRDLYEAYAVYNFYVLMVGLQGGMDELLRGAMAEGHGQTHAHPPPLCCAPRWRLSASLLQRITLAVLQFMLLKPLCTFIVLCLSLSGKYGPPQLNFNAGYVYCTIVYNVSITAAFTALYYFYLGSKAKLAGHNPVLKFACIKGVIFLSYWQSLVIDVLHSTGALPKVSGWENESDEASSAGLQDFLICCEMCLFAVVHKCAFSATEHADAAGAGATNAIAPSLRSSWRQVVQHDDIAHELRDLWRQAAPALRAASEDTVI
eukprot:TRINITY_DN2687_c3_g1_i2.p2 TRINITY_DN2687_c3_g1~~TRINITY_DN2687_c3_g1_i2.p2  ORF type:complete len:405 (+),score=137.32 TRINITY_DN2687_c3_g1_i2:53-1267(+)